MRVRQRAVRYCLSSHGAAMMRVRQRAVRYCLSSHGGK